MNTVYAGSRSLATLALSVKGIGRCGSRPANVRELRAADVAEPRYAERRLQAFVHGNRALVSSRQRLQG